MDPQKILVSTSTLTQLVGLFLSVPLHVSSLLQLIPEEAGKQCECCPTCLHPHPEARSLEMKCYVKRKNKNQKQRRHIFFLNHSIQDFISSLRKCCRVNPKALESCPESWMGVAKGWDMASGPLGFHSDANFPEGRQHKGTQAQHSLPHNRCMFLELHCIGSATPWALGQITAFWASGSSSVGVGSGEQVIVSCFFCVGMRVFSPFS